MNNDSSQVFPEKISIKAFLILRGGGTKYIDTSLVKIMKKEIDVKEYEITSTVEDTCFVDIREHEIKLENTEIQDNLDKFTFS